ncbi:MAG: 50S ribosome-binding GTPase, partial [Phycisphaerae bacterium]|nr:50S ribosome-binding GTPase [Phycisphaerae bacterium]
PMQLPATNDTVVALSTSWESAPLGIIRLSGPDAFDLAAHLGATLPDRCPAVTSATLALSREIHVPADLFWFAAPRSYTGQNLVEIHTIGSLPLLRMVAGEVLRRGARRALPGEFTARAYLNRRLDASQVDAVLTLVNAANAGDARRAARTAAGTRQCLLSETTERLTDVLALIEAGIDFVEEEDIHFATSAEVHATISDVLDRIDDALPDRRAEQHGLGTHVALVGMPNAGKSTLFNTLLGYERAIVSPVLGTTRDVLSAELHLYDHALVLQDCAGLGRSPDEIELSAHVAAERAADEADVVLWVHDASRPWTPDECVACARVAGPRAILVLSKIDLPASRDTRPATLEFAAEVAVSAQCEQGVDDLRRRIVDLVASSATPEHAGLLDDRLSRAASALRRALALVEDVAEALSRPEIVALELREALAELRTLDSVGLPDDLLGRIFGRFCLGK